jgi:hypothetical protein
VELGLRGKLANREKHGYDKGRTFTPRADGTGREVRFGLHNQRHIGHNDANIRRASGLKEAYLVDCSLWTFGTKREKHVMTFHIRQYVYLEPTRTNRRP